MIYRYSHVSEKELLFKLYHGIKFDYNELAESKSGKSKTHDIIVASADDILFFANKIKEKVSELVKEGHTVNVVVDGCAGTNLVDPNSRIEYDYDIPKLIKLVDLNNDLEKLGMSDQIKFNEFFLVDEYTDLKRCFKLDHITLINNEINKVVREIKEFNLSPYESMLYIHKYITQNYEYGKYSSDDNTLRDREWNRSIVTAIADRKTICAGFASLTKAIVDRLNNSNLKCEYRTLLATKNKDKRHLKSEGGHAINFIHIEDDKYHIKGTYANDATNDCKNEKFPNGAGYSFFMYPVEDVYNLKSLNFHFIKGSRTTIPKDFLKTKKSIIKRKEFVKKVDNVSSFYSEPIPYEVFERALIEVNSLKYRSKDSNKNKDIDDIIKSVIYECNNAAKDAKTDIRNSAIVAHLCLNDRSKNPFKKNFTVTEQNK